MPLAGRGIGLRVRIAPLLLRERLVSCSTGFSASGLACPVRIRHLFRWFSRATLGAMPLWLLTYKFTCSQAECGYHNALDAVAQADTPKTAASQVGKSQHLCGRCGRPLTDSSSLKMAVPVPISSVEKKRSVSESGKPPKRLAQFLVTGFLPDRQ